MASTARMRRVLATTRAALRAAVTPMETWSSLLAEVGIESTLAGWARPLFSEARAAAVTCAIMRPDWSPPSRVRKAGRPESAGFTRRSMRRSLIAPSSATAMARKSAAMATGSPWKFPPESISPVSANTMGLSVAALSSIVDACG